MAGTLTLAELVAAVRASRLVARRVANSAEYAESGALQKRSIVNPTVESVNPVGSRTRSYSMPASSKLRPRGARLRAVASSLSGSGSAVRSDLILDRFEHKLARTALERRYRGMHQLPERHRCRNRTPWGLLTLLDANLDPFSLGEGVDRVQAVGSPSGSLSVRGGAAMAQHGQVLRLRTRRADGKAMWAYRYRVQGRCSRRPQVGGFATRAEAERALRRTLERLCPGGAMTLAELVGAVPGDASGGAGDDREVALVAGQGDRSRSARCGSWISGGGDLRLARALCRRGIASRRRRRCGRC